MAYLNVRERRIEAKIAYVGPKRGGKATNFDRLRQVDKDSRIGRIDATDDVLSVAWQLPASQRFRDCDVLLKVVAHHGALSPALVDDVLRDADGVVLVVDAAPSAQDDNRASLDALRGAIARGDRRLPLVVQVNKTDLPDALATDDVVGMLGAASLPHVAAAALRGQGVVETLEAALREVLAALRSGGDEATAQSLEANGASAAGDGHPLLSALRKVLRDTVREHVDQVALRLESGVTTRIEEALDRLERRVAALEEARTELRGPLARLATVATANDDEARTMRLLERLHETDARVQELEIALAHSTGREGDELAALATQLERLRDELKSEVVRSSEARARADREHLAHSTASLKKSLDGVANGIDGVETRVEELNASLTVSARGIESLFERLDVAASDVRALSPRLDALEASLKRTVRLEELVRSLRAEMTESFSAADERTGAMHALIVDIVEELKKPKKGWFT
jgi:hypothetical protein